MSTVDMVTTCMETLKVDEDDTATTFSFYVLTFPLPLLSRVKHPNECEAKQ